MSIFLKNKVFYARLHLGTVRYEGIV